MPASLPPDQTTPRAFERPGLPDLIAGLSVALVLIPQSLAYASLAGLPPVFGLYASVLPPIAAAFFASSRYLQTGPVAVTSLLTLAALSAAAQPGSAQYLMLAPVLALVVGVMRLGIGFARAGFVAYLMSQPVLVGFTSAAALLIMASQIPVLVGVPVQSGHELAQASVLLFQPSRWSLEALLVGAATVALVVLGRRLHPLFPGVLIAAAGGIAWTHWAGAGTLPVVGPLPSAIPHLTLDFEPGLVRTLLVPGLVIALIGFAEPSAIARALATRERQAWSANRELVSQGVANVAAAVSGAFPVGGSFSRTMVNRLAGGETRWSGAITGLMVLAFLPFANVLAALPRAVLGGIIVAAVLGLVQLRALWQLVGISKPQALVGWTTFGLTLLLAPRVDVAVELGIGLGIAVHLWREREVHVRAIYDEALARLTLRPAGVLYFGSANVVDDALLQALSEHPGAGRLMLDLSGVGRLDYTGALVLERVARDAIAGGLVVEIDPGPHAHVRTLLERVLQSAGLSVGWHLAEQPLEEVPDRGR